MGRLCDTFGPHENCSRTINLLPGLITEWQIWVLKGTQLLKSLSTINKQKWVKYCSRRHYCWSHCVFVKQNIYILLHSCSTTVRLVNGRWRIFGQIFSGWARRQPGVRHPLIPEIRLGLRNPRKKESQAQIQIGDTGYSTRVRSGFVGFDRYASA